MTAPIGLIVTTVSLFGGGCREPSPTVIRPSAVTDPCPERLHELCGPLLLYHAGHGRFPARLEDLRAVAGPGEILSCECPVSGKPYLYDREGLAVSGAEKVIACDPVPEPSGVLWAIAVGGAGSGGTPNARVIALDAKSAASLPKTPAAPSP